MKVGRFSFALLLILFNFLLSQNLFSQKTSGNYKLKGGAADLNTGKPLSGVTVIISSRETGRDFAGTTTDDKGFFSINNIPEPLVKAKFSMVGYQTQIIDSVSLEMNNVLGLVKMRPTAIVMPEIVVKSLKPMIEYRLDRKVINMDMVPGSQGSVTDALRNSGALDVDPATNKISVHGEEVKLQMDGHPLNMPVDALAQLPASMIDQVEVILAPGAKESAEGGAYIVNLVSRKNTLDNYNGSLSLSSSTSSRTFGGINMNYKVSKVNLFGSFFGGFGSFGTFSETERINYFSSNLHFQKSNVKTTFDGFMGMGKLGLDYNMDDENSFTFYGNFSRQKGTDESRNESIVNNISGIQQYTYKNNNDADVLSDNLSLYGFYKRKFDKKGHEIILDALFTSMNSSNDNSMNTYYSYIANYPKRQDNSTGIKADVFTLKSDYTYPMGSGKLEAGYSFITRFRENDYNVGDYSYLKNMWLDSLGLSNRFRYTENIHALYATYTHRLGRFEVKAGLRMENLHTHGEQFTTNENFSENYLNLFPDLTAAYKITEMYQITFNTFRRVKYPPLYYVNPFKVYNGPNSFDIGNPKIEPYFLNAYSLNFFQVLNFYYVFSRGMFRGVSSNVQDSVTVNSYINLGKNQTYGIEVTLPYYNSPAMPVHLPGFISMLNIRFEYMWRKQEGAYLTEDLNYLVKRPSLNAALGLKLWYDVNASLNFYYVPSIENRREKNREVKQLYLSMSKSILDQKLRISLSVSDLLNSQSYEDETNGSNYYSKSRFRMENSRSISLSLSWMFNDYKDRRDRNLDDGRDGGKNYGL